MPELRTHQREALMKLRNGQILRGGVGSGKSRTAMAYYSDVAEIEHLYIITTAKKRDNGDWFEEARLWGAWPVVDSWNNMNKYKDVKNAFFIFDEQRLVGQGAWVSSFLQIAKHNQWILLSATPGDTWLDYIPVFIANGFYKNRTEFVRRHVAWKPYLRYPKVDHYLETAVLLERLREITVEMPFERHTTRHMIDVYAEYDEVLWKTVVRNRWNYLENRPIRNASELFSLMRRVTNSHPSRVQRIKDQLILHPKIIIFYNFDYELSLLREAFQDSMTMAEWNGHRHQSVPTNVTSWIYLVQYSAGSEAWECTDTDTIVFYSQQYSYRIFEQCQGRIDRMNTPFDDLWYYRLSSVSSIDDAIWQALENKRDFNEQDFLDKLV